jgi:ribosomal protein L14
MVFKESKVRACDGSGAGVTRVIHPYKKFKRRYSLLGEYKKASIKTLARLPRRIRGRRYRPLRRGFVVRGLLVRAPSPRLVGAVLGASCASSASVLVKRRGVLRSKYIYGPMQRPRFALKFRPHFSALF